ncbi:hypothetical protein KJ786_03315 [Patescibacteria group bacterium]|nr:hypothetical protein [Patescibacteria group bacterium]
MKDNKKLKKDILQALYDKRYALEFNKLKKELKNRFSYEEEIEDHLDIFSSKVMHILDLLVSDHLIQKKSGRLAGGRISTFYSLEPKGYELFEPWYKKIIIYFRKNIETVIISTIVSIVVYTIFLRLPSFLAFLFREIGL